MTGKLPDVTDANFQAEVLDSDGSVLVDFWAPWCGPCRVVHPILEEIAVERDDLRIVRLNVDENQQTAGRYEVLSIPTLILFKRRPRGQAGDRRNAEAPPRGRARARPGRWPQPARSTAIRSSRPSMSRARAPSASKPTRARERLAAT